MSSLITTLRYATRTIRREPGTSLLAVLVLALGIAGTTVTYSGVEAVVLRSLPFRDPARLVDIKQQTRERRATAVLGGTNSPISFEAVRAQTALFEDVAGYRAEQPVMLEGGDPERVRSWCVTANFFPLLGVEPLIGQAFTAADDQPNAPARAVLAHRFWMSRFGGDPQVIGRTITLDDQRVEIVGVMPRSLAYPRDAVLWRNLGSRPPEPRSGGPQGGTWIVGRLRPEVTVAAAEAQLDVVWEGLAREHPRFAGGVCLIMPLHAALMGTAATPLWLLLGAGVFVLAIACANVANLLLVRAMARQEEVAVRLALGARGTHIVGQFLAESLLLALAGGGAGVLLASWGIAWIASWWPKASFATHDVPALEDVALNGHVLALAMAVTIATGLIFGVVPGVWAAMRRTFPGSRAGVTRWRTRMGDLSLVGQLAITVMLLGAAGLVVLSLSRLLRVETGYDATGVVGAHLILPRATYPTPERIVAFGDGVIERLRASGEVTAAAISTGMPFGTGVFTGIGLDGNPPSDKVPWAAFTAVSADYFGVLQVPLRRGRWLRHDGSDAQAVLINESAARQYFGQANPLGHRLTAARGGGVMEIVGVVADTRDESLAGEPDPHVFQPFAAGAFRFVKVIVRTRGDQRTASAVLRGAVRAVDPRAPIDHIVSLRELMMDSILRWRLVMTLLAVFAGLALVMSAAGMYAVMAHQVARRRREMGIRIALGADRRRIRRLVVGRALALTIVGLLVGVGGAVVAGRVLHAFLFGVQPHDPLVLASVGLVLLGAVLLACWLPARRAARIDPATLLRAE